MNSSSNSEEKLLALFTVSATTFTACWPVHLRLVRHYTRVKCLLACSGPAPAAVITVNEDGFAGNE